MRDSGKTRTARSDSKGNFSVLALPFYFASQLFGGFLKFSRSKLNEDDEVQAEKNENFGNHTINQRNEQHDRRTRDDARARYVSAQISVVKLLGADGSRV